MTIVVGVTGNIASGKSTVAARFAEHGATLIDADVLARLALAPGTRGLAAVASRWPSVISADGSLDRAALRRIVFTDPKQRDRLNAIVHPEVARVRDKQLAAARERGDAFVAYDVPLLFEAGLEKTVDVIVLVEASDEIRRQRLAHRGVPADDATAMMASQMPDELKRGRSNFVIENNGDYAQLLARADATWHALANGAERG